MDTKFISIGGYSPEVLAVATLIKSAKLALNKPPKWSTFSPVDPPYGGIGTYHKQMRSHMKK